MEREEEQWPFRKLQLRSQTPLQVAEVQALTSSNKASLAITGQYGKQLAKLAIMH